MRRHLPGEINIYQDCAWAKLHNILEGTFVDLGSHVLQYMQAKSVDWAGDRALMDEWVTLRVLQVEKERPATAQHRPCTCEVR